MTTLPIACDECSHYKFVPYGTDVDWGGWCNSKVALKYDYPVSKYGVQIGKVCWTCNGAWIGQTYHVPPKEKRYRQYGLDVRFDESDEW